MNADYLAAMKADAIPEGESGLWYVTKRAYEERRSGECNGKRVWIDPGTYTYLYVYTDSTIHLLGELVMEDSAHELRTHLGFVMHACGHVLVTGLGLGCVVRGLLANPRVEQVTCIENSPDVLKLVAPHMPGERLTIVEADALEWTAKNKQRFDCAWHDLWTNRDNGEPHLDVWHARLLVNCKRTVRRQGCWMLRREAKTLLVRRGFPWIG